ncbi:hypothetical protein [Baia soyae]|uniref:hypothetical protein n=1 Tax=Baia soyae TaxID=1544746 RepID=UPI001404371D|nr:hypothetical protein [Baia soyae]
MRRVCSITAMLAILLSVGIRSVGRFWCNLFERSLRVLHLPERRIPKRTPLLPCWIGI